MSRTTCVLGVSCVTARLADLGVGLMAVVGVSLRLPVPMSLVSNPVSRYRSLSCVDTRFARHRAGLAQLVIRASTSDTRQPRPGGRRPSRSPRSPPEATAMQNLKPDLGQLSAQPSAYDRGSEIR